MYILELYITCIPSSLSNTLSQSLWSIDKWPILGRTQYAHKSPPIVTKQGWLFAMVSFILFYLNNLLNSLVDSLFSLVILRLVEMTHIFKDWVRI